MLFVEGIGYVDETTYLSNTNKTDNTSTTDFDSILSVETDKLNNTSQSSLDDIFKEASETYNVSYDLLKAIAYNESRYQADATSSSGAMGIMQLMPSTAQAMGVSDAYDPYDNIMGGAKLLSKLSDLYNGNQTLMIAAYNAGSGTVSKYGGVPPFAETQNYVAKILNTMESGTPSANIAVQTAAAGDSVSSDNTDSVTTNTSTTNANTINASTTNTNTANTVSSANQQSNSAAYAALNLMSSSSSYISSMLNTDSTSTLSSILNSSDLYNSTDLSDSFSYEEYELLMQYYDNMLNIISSIGDSDDSSDSDSTDSSLLDLYKLSNTYYTQSNIDL